MLGYYVTTAVLSFAIFLGGVYGFSTFVQQYVYLKDIGPFYIIADIILSVLFLILAIRFTKKAVLTYKESKKQEKKD